MSAEDVSLVEALCRFAVQYELESIEAVGIKIVKKVHRVERAAKDTERPAAVLELPGDEELDDDILFRSTLEPRRTVEDIARQADREAGREPQ